MTSHFDLDADAPQTLADDEMPPVASAAVPPAEKRPLWDQPKVQLAALAVFAVVGLAWKLSASAPATPAPPHFASTVTPAVAPPPAAVTESAPVSSGDTRDAPPTSLADDLSRALNAQQVYSEKTREGLTALAQRLAAVEQRLSAMQTPHPPAVTPPVPAPVTLPAATAVTSPRAPSRARVTWSGQQAQINSLYPGLAWVTWRGSSWALRPGDRFAGATVLRIDERQREVVTSSGVIR